MTNQIVSFVLTRLKEPTTYVGLGSFLTAVGFAVRPDLWQQISVVCMGVSGLIATFMAENKPAA